MILMSCFKRQRYVFCYILKAIHQRIFLLLSSERYLAAFLLCSPKLPQNYDDRKSPPSHTYINNGVSYNSRPHPMPESKESESVREADLHIYTYYMENRHPDVYPICDGEKNHLRQTSRSDQPAKEYLLSDDSDTTGNHRIFIYSSRFFFHD